MVDMKEQWRYECFDYDFKWRVCRSGVIFHVADKNEAMYLTELLNGSEAQTEKIKELKAALKGLSDLYTHAFDLVDGGLIMLPGSIKLFEKRHAIALAALKGESK